MRVYHERLAVPLSWWVGGLAVIVLLCLEVAAGLGWLVGVGVYAALAGIYAWMLLTWGHARIEVTGTELRAGGAQLPLAEIDVVEVLDAAQARAARGPQADPAAFLLVRPYLRTGVFVAPAAVAGREPYWLIASRDPHALASSIETAAAAVRAGGQTVG
jgi:hypothetical protein